jgi:hypothetical protein
MEAMECGAFVQAEFAHFGGNNPSDYAWTLSLSGDGQGVLRLGGNGQRSLRIFVPEKVRELEGVMREVNFCALPSDCGTAVLDHAHDRVIIRTSTLEKAVVVGNLDACERAGSRLWRVIAEMVHQRASGESK